MREGRNSWPLISLIDLHSFGLADELRDDGSEGEQGHEGNDAEGDDAVDTPDAENIFFDVGEVEGEGESGEGGDEEQAVGAEEGEGGHEDVSGDADGGDGDGAEHGVGAVIDDAAVPVLVDAAGGIAVVAVVLAESEGGDDDAEYGQDQERVFHVTPLF
jgi:hypothetical protein